ncbi:MAG TPA: HEPN domain-containing protein [Leptolyngbyaceae cyanobacterium]
MPKSARFRTLTKELTRLKKQFLPKISPTGLYSDRQLSRTMAYTVLAHAEIESYLEDRAWEVVQDAKKVWNNTRKAGLTLVSIIAFSGQTMELPPETLTPRKGSKNVRDEKIKLNKKINLALESFSRVINQNHGVKEANILALLLPIGIDSDDLNRAWLATMNTFGEKRGLIAHKSAIHYRTIQTPNPADELNTVRQITQELLKVDELINQLMK